MSQNIFIFKHFIIKQDKTAMKVGTDAMILGAWAGERSTESDGSAESDSVESGGWKRVENQLSAESERAKSQGGESENYKILDIGTGTGVLALILAQRLSPLSLRRPVPPAPTISGTSSGGIGGEAIDAVEIDENSYNQAKENIENSSWKNRIRIFHTSIQDFDPGHNEKYDLIISNPPYFEHNLKADKESSRYRERSHSRSLNTLGFEDLLIHSKRLLKENGSFYVIIPFVSTESILTQAEKEGLTLFDRLNIKSTENQEPVRSILGLTKIKRDIRISELVIYNDDKSYTQDYIRLTADYYAKDFSKSNSAGKK